MKFNDIENEALILRHSLYVCSTAKVIDYFSEHGSIGLTPSKNFQRKFIDWAATAFAWPGYTSEDLYAVNKVLNEIDLPPLGFIHEMLIAMKIARHFKGECKLTRNGKELVGDIPKLFGLVAPFFLFRFDHGLFSRFDERPLGNWDLFLNVINIEAETAITEKGLYEKLYGAVDEENDIMARRKFSSLYASVLRPLCWLGLLEELRPANSFLADRLYVKTPLWRVALNLKTDHML